MRFPGYQTLVLIIGRGVEREGDGWWESRGWKWRVTHGVKT